MKIAGMLFAIALASIIAVRVICVVHQAIADAHHNRTAFLAFGYSYIVLGAAAVFAVVALVDKPDLAPMVLWLFLIGSAGLIVFDRRHR